MSEPALAAPAEDRVLPAIIYGLYLLGPVNGLTAVIGLVLAHMNRAGAPPRAQSHYIFLIRTFWLTIGWAILGGLLVLFGLPLSFVLVGIPFLVVGWIILSLVGVWFILRTVVGVIYLARDEAYPRPFALIL